MIGFGLLLFPFVLLGFVLLMARVEQPLENVTTDRDVETFLATANRSEMNAFVAEGPETAMRRFRGRLGRRRGRRGVRRAAD